MLFCDTATDVLVIGDCPEATGYIPLPGVPENGKVTRRDQNMF
jgi:hypothetical protein